MNADVFLSFTATTAWTPTLPPWLALMKSDHFEWNKTIEDDREKISM